MISGLKLSCSISDARLCSVAPFRSCFLVSFNFCITTEEVIEFPKPLLQNHISTDDLTVQLSIQIANHWIADSIELLLSDLPQHRVHHFVISRFLSIFMRLFVVNRFRLTVGSLVLNLLVFFLEDVEKMLTK